jgi:hypothetical protein
MTAYASLYLANDAPLPLDFLQRMVPFAQVAAAPAGNGTAGGYALTAPAWRLQMNVMPAEQVPAHLQSFAGWITGPGGTPQTPAAQDVLRRLGETKLVLGCVAEPGFDPSGYVRRTLTAIARPGRGLVFSLGAVYDADGVLLLGAQGAGERFLPGDLSPAQRWTLATTAIVTRYFNESHERLGGTVVNPGTILRAKRTLGDPWGIGDRKDLMAMLKHLAKPEEEQSFRKLAATIAAGAPVAGDVSAEDVAFVRTYAQSLGPRGLLADDLCRLVYVAGNGYVAGYLSEAEAWGWALAAAHRLQAAYASWEELGQHYLLGVTWRRGRDEDLEQSYRELLADPGSPWRAVPWGTPLG